MKFVYWDGEHNGPENMARDAQLLESSGPLVRIYGWISPWVTLGNSQVAEHDLLPICPVPSTIRPTGGRAVLHGHDLTLGFGLPLLLLCDDERGAILVRRSVKTVYRSMVGCLVEALQVCSIDAALGEDVLDSSSGTRSKSADCFLGIAPNDVISRSTGRKICGVAMKIDRTSALIQASIPILEPLVDPSLVYAQPARITPISLDRIEFQEALEQIVSRNFRPIFERK